MKILDYLFFIGYQAAKHNGFEDAQALYGKIVLSAILYFNYLSFIHVLHLLGFKSLILIENLVFLFAPLVLFLVIAFMIYPPKKITAVLNQRKFKIVRIKLKFNIMLIGSLLLLFLTTISVGPQV